MPLPPTPSSMGRGRKRDWGLRPQPSIPGAWGLAGACAPLSDAEISALPELLPILQRWVRGEGD
jgi:hypothetical protein